MKALILAAGRGSRLQPYTADCPKCLTELAGVSLIDRQLQTLRAVGVSDVTIATGYRADMLALPGTRQVHNPDWADTNMVETLFCAAGEFGDDIIVSYSDIVYEPRVIDALLASPHDVSVVVDTKWRSLWELRFDDPLSDAESLRLSDDGRILDIGNKVADIDQIAAQYIGLMRFRGDGVRALTDTRSRMGDTARDWMAKRPLANAYMTDLLMEMILRGVPVHAVPTAGGWLEVDTVEDLHTYERMFADGTIAAYFDPHATPVDGPVNP